MNVDLKYFSGTGNSYKILDTCAQIFLEDDVDCVFYRLCTLAKGDDCCVFEFYRKGTAPDNAHLNKYEVSVRIREKDHHNSQTSFNYRKEGVKMAMSVRKNPFVCLLLSLGRVLIGRLKYSKEYVGTTLKMENGEAYHIFRHIRSVPQSHDEQGSVFIVNFKFARLSQNANRLVSQVPMLLITGFPGFRVKMYGMNKENGYWLGIYQWESKQALDAYKQSLVLRIMNSRAIEGSVTYHELDHYRLTDYIEEHKINDTLSSSMNKHHRETL